VFDRLSKKLAGILTAAVLSAGMLAQAQKAPAVKDQGEYDITQAITKEKDPQKQLELLKQWEQKYPDSDFSGQRSLSIAQAESQVAAKGMAPNAPPADLDAAQKAAQDLADNLDKYLSPANKPANATDDQWKAAHSQLEQQAHTVLATIAMNKKTPTDDAAAEKEFKKVLELSPGNASAAYTLGTLILRERKVERIPEGLFYIARATEITGPMALNAQGKTAADTYLKKAYAGYHGDEAGLDDVKKAANGSPTMPPGFTIKSVTDIEKEKEGDAAAFAAANPDKALWRQIRGALTAADGDMYFMQIKDAQVPPAGQAGFTMFRAKIVSQPSPKEILVNVDNAAGDATLKFENPLKGTFDPGMDIKFKGVVDSFQKEPYMLTFAAEKEDVDGLPASAFAGAPATPRKRPPATGAKKK
jgi:hypothetical protein